MPLTNYCYVWSDIPQEFIEDALSPAKILSVGIVSEEEKEARVEVSEDQQSLAIGKGGQNVRLAAKLTGWKIDIQSPQSDKSNKEADIEDTVLEEKEKDENNTEKSKDAEDAKKEVL